MSKYVVFKCTKCGKVNIHEVRKTSSEKGYYLSCKFCEKKSNYLRAIVYQIYDLPSEATALMNQINLGEIKVLPLKEAEKLYQLGITFMSREKNKVHSQIKEEKRTKIDIVYEVAKEMIEFSYNDLKDACMAEGITQSQFEKLFIQFQKEGTFVEQKRNEFKFYP